MSLGRTGDALLITVSPSESVESTSDSEPDAYPGSRSSSAGAPSCGFASALALAVSMSIWLCILSHVRLMTATCPTVESRVVLVARAVDCMLSHRVTTAVRWISLVSAVSVTAPIWCCNCCTSASSWASLSCISLKSGALGDAGSIPAPSRLFFQWSKMSLHSSLICAAVEFLICVASPSSCFCVRPSVEPYVACLPLGPSSALSVWRIDLVPLGAVGLQYICDPPNTILEPLAAIQAAMRSSSIVTNALQTSKPLLFLKCDFVMCGFGCGLHLSPYS